MVSMRRYLLHVLKSRRRLRIVCVAFTAILVLLTFHRHSIEYSPLDNLQRIRLFIFGEYLLTSPGQHDINYMARYLHVNYTVVDNFPRQRLFSKRHEFLAKLTITNTGNYDIPDSDWQMYGYLFMLAQPASYPYKNGFYLYHCGLKMYHITGNLYLFKPIPRVFQPVPSKTAIECHIHLTEHQISRTDSMPKWYFTGNNLTPRIIENTNDETLRFVGSFDEPNKYRSVRYEHSKPYTPQDRYRLYKKDEVPNTDELKIIPTPLFCDISSKTAMHFEPKGYMMLIHSEFAREMKHFGDLYGIKLVRSKPNRKYIVFNKARIDLAKEIKSTDQPLPKVITSEAYILETFPHDEAIRIVAETPTGAFYALQTLASILFLPEAQSAKNIIATLPKIRIVDAPRYAYRGIHIDVARNFIGMSEILKTIEVISQYKMNRLHLHLSDDEGWRLEIPGIPELTQVGGHRCHDMEEQQCILPNLGSGPFSNSSGSGFYAVEEYKHILTFANRRHVKVIPEFDMPGHSRAAIKSIHAESQQSHRRSMKATIYSLLDENDKSVYKSGQHFTDNVMNPCKLSTYSFVRKLMQSVKEMHEDIQPLTFYHFGGDEVASGAWDGSPACKQLMKDTPGISTHYDLMRYFINKVAGIGSEEGISLGAWEDGMLSHGSDLGVPFPRSSFQNDDIYVYVWKRPNERRTPHRARLFANMGYKIILAYGSYLYFDHPYEPDPEERGLYWATRKISNYDAWSFTQNVMNADLTRECPPEIKNLDNCFKLQKPENIMGVQAELWSETVRTSAQLEYMLFPRLLAVAERAWHKAPWEDMEASNSQNAKRVKAADWSVFANKIGYHELRRLDQKDVQYRVSIPGAIVVDGKAKFNTEFPGQDVEYLHDVSKTWHLVSHGMRVTSPIWIRSKSANGSRHSRAVLLDPQHSSGFTIGSNLYTQYLFLILIFVVVKSCLV